MAAVLSLACVAGAQETSSGTGTINVSEPVISRGQGWSVLSGQTVGSGATVIVGQLGWPGISATLLHGATDKLDVGARLGLNYGREGIITDVVSGIRAQLVVRLKLWEKDRVTLGAWTAPGPIFYFDNAYYTMVGLTVPLGFVVGIQASSALVVNVGVEVPFWVSFGAGGRANFPILVGAGAEYYLDRRLAVSLNFRMGPTVNYYRWGSSVFTLESLIGVEYKF